MKALCIWTKCKSISYYYHCVIFIIDNGDGDDDNDDDDDYDDCSKVFIKAPCIIWKKSYYNDYQNKIK